MLPGILFLLRRGQDPGLGVIVDHGLCQDLVVRIALDLLQVLLHEAGDLIHVEGDIRDLLRLYIADGIQKTDQTAEGFTVFHICSFPEEAWPSGRKKQAVATCSNT